MPIIELPTAEVLIPLCPWCEEPLDGPCVNGLHSMCNEAYNKELSEWETGLLVVME
jgi:hypothetical protein